MKKKLLLVCCSLCFFFLPTQAKEIKVYFDTTPESVVLEKSPLKYNKDFAYSYVFDDGYGEGYDYGFGYLNGGYIDGSDQRYPGLYHTDGAGNQVGFRGGFATTLVNNAGNDIHIDTPGYITFDEFDQTYELGWNILHHGYGVEPVTNYLQDILSGVNYMQAQTQNNILLQHFIIPDGLGDYAAYVFSGGMKSIAAQRTDFFFNGQNNIVTSDPVDVNTVDIDQYAMYRYYIHEEKFLSGGLLDDVIALASGATASQLWRHAFSHRIEFGTPGAGSISRPTRKSLVDYIYENHGEEGDDSVRFAGPQEVYEYLSIRDAIILATGSNKNVLTITLDDTNVDPDFVTKSLSLLISATGANIVAVVDENDDFVHVSYNAQSGLINLDRGLVNTQSLLDKVEIAVSQAEILPVEANIQQAQERTNHVSTGLTKEYMQRRVNALTPLGKQIQISFGGSTNSRGVRNFYNGSTTGSSPYTNLFDANGIETEVDVSISTSFSSKYDGQEAPVDGDGIFPNEIMRRAVGQHGNNLDPATGSVRLDDLDPNSSYSLTLFGSTTNTQVSDRTVTIYEVNGEQKELTIRQNITEVVEYNNIQPTSSGYIDIFVAQKDKNRGYGYLNALALTEEVIQKPRASVVYSHTGPTAQPVTVSLTGIVGSGVTITNNSGEQTMVVSSNGIYTFNLEDQFGTTGEAVAYVNRIESAMCGDGVKSPSEECDDSNLQNQDGCSATCMVEFCGDGITQAGIGEQCDDGNTANNDGCDASCLIEFCGDGITQSGIGEQCDDGNTANNDGCDAVCLIEFCGDGVTQSGLGEQCDDGNNNGNIGFCNATCTDQILVTTGVYADYDSGTDFSGGGGVLATSFTLYFKDLDFSHLKLDKVQYYLDNSNNMMRAWLYDTSDTVVYVSPIVDQSDATGFEFHEFDFTDAVLSGISYLKFAAVNGSGQENGHTFTSKFSSSDSFSANIDSIVDNAERDIGGSIDQVHPKYLQFVLVDTGGEETPTTENDSGTGSEVGTGGESETGTGDENDESDQEQSPQNTRSQRGGSSVPGSLLMQPTTQIQIHNQIGYVRDRDELETIGRHPLVVKAIDTIYAMISERNHRRQEVYIQTVKDNIESFLENYDEKPERRPIFESLLSLFDQLRVAK